jgi:hypothetical protein
VLTTEERMELECRAADGHFWIARDKDGRAFAYSEKPYFVGYFFETDGDLVTKLENEYAFLSPGDEPLEICALLDITD